MEFGIFPRILVDRRRIAGCRIRRFVQRNRGRRALGPRRRMACRNPHEPDALAVCGTADPGERHRGPHLAHQDRHGGADPAAWSPVAPRRGDRDDRSQISNGRLIFGVGRSAFPRAYHAYGIAYEESQDRFAESLDFIKKAWTEPGCSHRGHYHAFDNFTLVPQPVQQPHPPIRVAASQPDTYDAIGKLGYPLFSATRASPLSRLADQTRAYRAAWEAAGHPGEPQAYLQVPVYVADTEERAMAEAEAGMTRFSSYRADLLRGPLSYAEILADKGIVGTPRHGRREVAATARRSRPCRCVGRDQPGQHAEPRASDGAHCACGVRR